VEARSVADVVDLSMFDEEAFDAVVCYGGPLSWVLAERDRASTSSRSFARRRVRLCRTWSR